MTAYDTLRSLISRRGTGNPGSKLIVAESELRALLEEHEALLAEKHAGGFELFDHLNQPSRRNPFAAAAAVNLCKRSVL